MKHLIRDGMCLDLTDDATEADVQNILAFVGQYQAEQAQMQKDFNSLWEKHGKNQICRALCLEWFKMGYELKAQRGIL